MGALFDVDDSVLVVIDVQPRFLGKVDAQFARQVSARIAWLVRAAVSLGVPVVVTEEEPDRNGTTHPDVLAALPDGIIRHVKPTFGLAFTPSILDAVRATGRRSAVVCGLETDVCVSQSAIGLLDEGWKVAVVSDAVASPGSSHEQGLERMRAAGVALIGLKGLWYEWIRRVDRLGEPGLRGDPPYGITM